MGKGILDVRNTLALGLLRTCLVRSAVEQAPGVIKQRCHVHAAAPGYGISTQVCIVYAVIALHIYFFFFFLQLYDEDIEEI
jgi:hypothetical protein